MGFLKKIIGQKEISSRSDNPFWAASFAPSEYQRFLQLVSAYFDQRGEQYKIENGTIFLQGQDWSNSLNLQNIAQKCQQSGPDGWPALIEEHFNRVTRFTDEGEAFANNNPDFDQIKSCLAVRIWPDGTLEATGRENLVYREDMPGTISALVFDLPDTVQAVNPAMIKKWRISAEELFDIGLTNVRKLCQPERYVKELGQGVRVHVLTSDSFFTATYALLIDELPDLAGTYGTLFGIPQRQVMICYPMQEVQSIQALQQMVPIILQLFQEGPGSVSPHLYWYWQGKYLAIQFNPQKKTVYIPPEFTAVLNQIAEQAKK